MIERRRRPRVAVVAHATIFAESSLMRIVVAVATGAVLGCVMKSIARMAFAACNRCMQPIQWKRGKVVIESQPSMPCGLRVALSALNAELSTVRIINAVALTTSCWYESHR